MPAYFIFMFALETATQNAEGIKNTPQNLEQLPMEE